MIIVFLLILMSLQDMYTMRVSDLFQLILLAVIVITTKLELLNIAVAVAIMASYHIYQRNTEYKIGGADIKLISLLTLLSITNTISILFWSSLIAIIYSLLLKQRKIAYVPFLSLGYIIVNV